MGLTFIMYQAMKYVKLLLIFILCLSLEPEFSAQTEGNSKDSLNKPTKLMIGFGLNTTVTRSIAGPAWSLGFTDYYVEPILTVNPSIQTILKLKKSFYLNTALSYYTIGYNERINETNMNIKDRIIFHRDKFLGLNFNLQYHFNSFFVGLGTSFLILIQYKKIEDGKINPYGPRGSNDVSSYYGDYNFIANSNGILYSKDFKCGYLFSIKKSFVIVPEIIGSIYRPLDKNFGLFRPGVGYFSAGINLSILYKLK